MAQWLTLYAMPECPLTAYVLASGRGRCRNFHKGGVEFMHLRQCSVSVVGYCNMSRVTYSSISPDHMEVP